MSNNYLGLTYGIIAAIIWGIFPVLTQFSLDQSLSSQDIIALRFIVSGPLLCYVLWQHRNTTLSFTCICFLVCGAGAPYLLLVVGGLTFAPASHFGAITPSSMLIFSAIGSWIWLNETFSVKRVLGISIIVIGIFSVCWDGMNFNGKNVWIGDLMFLLGGLLWATYTLSTRRWSVDPLHAIALVSVFSMILYMPPYFFYFETTFLSAPFTEVVFQGIFQGILSVLIALLLYTKSIKLLGASRAALFAALVPGIALILSIPVLNESPSFPQIIGILTITIGMVYAIEMKTIKYASNET